MTRLFSHIFLINIHQSELNNGLQVTSSWPFQWKRHFPTNKSKRYIFREKAFVVTFNNVKVTASSSQKHLGILLDQQPTLINMSKVKRLCATR